MSVQNGKPNRDRIAPSKISRYDLLLAVLPLTLLGGIAIGSLWTLPLHAGVALGALPSMVLVGYGLFADAPVSPPTRDSNDWQSAD